MSTLSEAARYNDAMAEEHTLESVIMNMNLHPDEVHHVASQRALRVILMLRGEIGDITKQNNVRLSGEERELMLTLTAVAMDGIAIGTKAAILRDSDV